MPLSLGYGAIVVFQVFCLKFNYDQYRSEGWLITLFPLTEIRQLVRYFGEKAVIGGCWELSSRKRSWRDYIVEMRLREAALKCMNDQEREELHRLVEVEAYGCVVWQAA